MKTRTASCPLGFRRNGSPWMSDLAVLSRWAAQAGFECLELPKAEAKDLETVRAAGLQVASVDLPQPWSDLLSPDEGKRKAAVERQAAFIRSTVELGVRNFFCVAIPESKDGDRLKNYKLAVESFGALAQVAATLNARINFEGWPGGPGAPNLFCNPESLRAIFKDTGPAGLGINYDPSHLILMGIDHVRFLQEFATRVGHVHGKDTETMPEEIYEVGLYQPSLFKKPFRWGTNVWRYTIPGHGQARWIKCQELLKAAGYQGAVSVELEDTNFCGSEAGEKEALTKSLGYLAGV